MSTRLAQRLATLGCLLALAVVVMAAPPEGDNPFGDPPGDVANPFDDAPSKTKPKKSAPRDASDDNPFGPSVAKPSKAKPKKINVPKIKPPKAIISKTKTKGASLRLSNEQRIRKALTQPAQLEFENVPLADVMTLLSERFDIPVRLDYQAVEDIPTSPDDALTLSAKDVTLRAALDRMLGQLDLTWTIRHEVLLITTEDKYTELLDTKVYDVADLVGVEDERGNVVESDFDYLIDVLTSTIDPASWEEGGGGMGTISGYEARGINVLVVSQVRHVHEEIEKLLKSLRDTRSKNAADPAKAGKRRSVRRRRTGPFGFGEVSTQPPLPPLAVDANRDAVVQSNNALALDLYAKLRGRGEGNVCFSPYSIS